MDYLLHHLLRASARRFPDKDAIVCRGETLTYSAMWRQTGGMAAGLRSAGVQRSDRVALLLEPSTELAVSIFGVSRAGAAFVPIHHSLFAEQVEHILSDCETVGLITSKSRLEQIAELLPRCPSLRFVALVDADEPAQPLPIPVYSYRQWTEATADDLRDVAIQSDLAAILYTSGSTGKPKGVMLSHANLTAGASIVSEYLQITERDRILAVLPFSFDAGLNQLTTAIQQGGTCVIMKFLFAREIVAMLESERITGLAGVPPLWSLLAEQSSKLHETPLPHLRYITNTGGAMPQPVLARLRAALPTTQVVLMYGLTEAFRSTYLPPEELDRRPGSMGKAIPNTEILVINSEGQPCRPGEVGELVHRGPTVSLGYWGDPELTSRVLRPHPFPPPGSPVTERVCYSGDLVRMDEDGFLYFVGRRDNLIKSSGFRISPTEVESALCRAGEGKVREAAVIGLPDERLGQWIKAFVVPHGDSQVDLNELSQSLAKQLPRHMLPREIEVRRELPKGSSGKIDYQALRQDELRKASVSTSNEATCS